MPDFKQIAEVVSLAVDGTGVLVIVLGLVIASVRFSLPGARRASDGYRQYRQNLGKAILLGLEFMVAGDIIRTVAVDPTLRSVLVLGLIVLIRTFLSLSLEVELEGRLPWQGNAAPDRPKSE